MITVTVPIRLDSTANNSQGVTRGGRIWRSKKRQKQKSDVALVLRSKLRTRVELPAVVMLTRIGPRSLDDDNLAYAFKGIRDQVAQCMGIDDRDPRVAWKYSQMKGEPRQYGIMIQIETRTT